MEFDINDIDDSIHSRVRLGILAHLVATKESNFQALKRALGLSDGNLGTHLSRLEQSGYVEMHKTFSGKKPLTTVCLTQNGRDALVSYLNEVRKVIDFVQVNINKDV